MTWTIEHAAAARQEGWGVFDVVEHDDPTRMTSQVLQLADRFPSHREAQRFVVDHARLGSKLHVLALRVVVASHAPRKKARPR